MSFALNPLVNRAVNDLLSKAFRDFKIASSISKTGEINVEHLKMNPDADVFSFLRGLPVAVVDGTVASLAVSIVFERNLAIDALKVLLLKGQLDLNVRVKVSDVLSACAFSLPV